MHLKTLVTSYFVYFSIFRQNSLSASSKRVEIGCELVELLLSNLFKKLEMEHYHHDGSIWFHSLILIL